MTQPIEKHQVKILHTLASKLKLTDGEYRAMLSGYPASSGEGCATSSKDLTKADAKTLIAQLEKRAVDRGLWKKGTSRSVREGIVGTHRGEMASDKQIDMIEALWSLVSKLQDADARASALNVFIHRRFNRGGIRMVERSLVHKIVATLQAMQEQKENKDEIAE